MNNIKRSDFKMIDVYIVTYGILKNQYRDLVRCIKSIKASDIPTKRIIILAKKITLELREFAKKENLILRKQKTNKLLGFHRAECIRDSSTEWCLFVDDDIYIAHDWYSRIKPFMKENTLVVQGRKQFEKLGDFDVTNTLVNVFLKVKSIIQYREIGTHICSFENTLVNAKKILFLGGDKVLEQHDSREDWNLNIFLNRKGFSWISVDNLVVIHQSTSLSEQFKKMSWYSKGVKRKKGLFFMKSLGKTIIYFILIIFELFKQFLFSLFILFFGPMLFLIIRLKTLLNMLSIKNGKNQK
ncbi:MAG: glycosyltransferase family A protein [Candidatus Woesearchaeota archaeon]